MTTTSTSTTLYWHFSTGTNGYGDGRPIPVGRWQRMKRHPRYGLTPVLCAAGMHASRRAIDALDSRRGPIVSLCELRGEVQHGVDKSVGRWRRVVAQADATAVLHRFAVWCAARALRQCEMTNPSCWHALRVKSRWIVGKATDGELKEAWEAACAVYGIRAASAAAAATSPAAIDAAISTAYTASTAYAAAAGAAYVDEREMQNEELELQNEELEKRLLKLLGRR